MKKKWFILLSVGILLLSSFTGCSQTDPKELYQGAVDKMNKLEQVDMEMNMNMSMSALGETMNIVMDSHIQTAAEEFLMESSVEIPGQGSAVTNVYYTDGYLYLDTQGQQIKAAASLEDAMSMLDTEDLSIGEDLEIVQELKAETENDVTTLYFTIDGSQMTDFVTDQTASLQDGESMEGVTVGEVTGTMTLNRDGYATELTLDMPFSMTVEGETIEVQMTMELVYHNPGQPVTMSFPDFSSYVEAA